MPYELRGTKVVRSDTGQVVKDHKGDRRKALAHLRALKANVEEASPVVLGRLLEGFDQAAHPRGWHGRWIRGRGGKPGRLEGTYNGVKLERGRAYQGKLASGEVFTGHWTGTLDHGKEPVFKHVDDSSIQRTFRGGEFFGRLSDVAAKPPSAPNEHRSDEMASGPLTRVSATSLGRASAPQKISGPSVAVSTKDGRRISLDAARREQSDYMETHAKPSPYLPTHVRPYGSDDPAGGRGEGRLSALNPNVDRAALDRQSRRDRAEIERRKRERAGR